MLGYVGFLKKEQKTLYHQDVSTVQIYRVSLFEQVLNK